MSKKQKKSAHFKNGFRVYREVHRSHGWRVKFKVAGTSYTRYFADSAYRSAAAAKQAAEEFALRNSDLHEQLLALRRRFEVRRNSRSGLPGVSRYSGRSDGRGPYWIAYWDDEQGRRCSRRFSIKRLGETQARSQAIEARRNAVEPFRQRYVEVLAALGLRSSSDT